MSSLPVPSPRVPGRLLPPARLHIPAGASERAWPGRRSRVAGGLGILVALLLAGCDDDPAGPPGSLPEGPRVFVVNTLSETLSALDPETGTVTVQAAVCGAFANRLTATADARRLLLANSGDNEIAVLDAGDLSVLAAVDVGEGRNPWIARSVDGRRALVSNWLAAEVRILDLEAATAGASIATTPGPEGFALVGNLAFVACSNYQGATGTFGEGRLDVVDLGAGAVVASIPVGTNPQDVVVGPDGRIHVLCTGDYAGDGRVDIVDPDQRAVVVTRSLAGSPERLAAGPDGAMWVVGFAGGLRRYDPATAQPLADEIDARIAGASLSALAVDEAAGRVYVTSFADDALFALDAATRTVAGVWQVGDGPVDAVVVRPDGD